MKKLSKILLFFMLYHSLNFCASNSSAMGGTASSSSLINARSLLKTANSEKPSQNKELKLILDPRVFLSPAQEALFNPYVAKQKALIAQLKQEIESLKLKRPQDKTVDSYLEVKIASKKRIIKECYERLFRLGKSDSNRKHTNAPSKKPRMLYSFVFNHAQIKYYQCHPQHDLLYYSIIEKLWLGTKKNATISFIDDAEAAQMKPYAPSKEERELTNTNIKDDDTGLIFPVLAWAIFKGHKKNVRALLLYGADPSGKGPAPKYNCSLFQTVQIHDPFFLEILIEHGLDLKNYLSGNWPALTPYLEARPRHLELINNVRQAQTIVPNK